MSTAVSPPELRGKKALGLEAMLLPEQRDVLWKRSSGGGAVRNSKHNLSRCQTHHITSQDGRTDDRSRRPSFDFDVCEALQAPDPRSSSQLRCLPAPRVTVKWRRKCICILNHVDAHLPLVIHVLPKATSVTHRGAAGVDLLSAFRL